MQHLDLASKQSSSSHLLVMGDFNYPGINYRDNVVEAGPNTEASKFFFKIEDLFGPMYNWRNTCKEDKQTISLGLRFCRWSKPSRFRQLWVAGW